MCLLAGWQYSHCRYFSAWLNCMHLYEISHNKEGYESNNTFEPAYIAFNKMVPKVQLSFIHWRQAVGFPSCHCLGNSRSGLSWSAGQVEPQIPPPTSFLPAHAPSPTALVHSSGHTSQGNLTIFFIIILHHHFLDCCGILKCWEDAQKDISFLPSSSWLGYLILC